LTVYVESKHPIEKSLDLLIKDNDRAADYILVGDLPNALNMLEKMEKLMEVCSVF